MKKLIIFIIISVIIFSCKEIENNPNSFAKNNSDELLENLTNLRDSVEAIGRWHNVCLDTLFTRLERVKNGDTSNIGSMSWEEYVILQTVDFANNLGLPGDSIDSEEIAYDVYWEIEDIIENNDFSINGENLLTALDDAIDIYTNDENYNNFENTCDSIITQALNLIDDIEKIAIGSSASVAKHSAFYWSNPLNIQRLENLCAVRLSSKELGSSISGLDNRTKRIITSDLKGAVSGGISGGIWGTTVGPAGTVAGAIAGALIHGSCSSFARGVIDEVINLPWWLDWVI